MKFKKTIIITSVALALSIGGYMYADSKTSVAEIDAMKVSYNTLSELESRSELIISGKPAESVNHVVRNADGLTEEAYTITSFKVDGVYASKAKKQLNQGDIIKVAEPFYIVDNGIKPGKTQFAIEGYEPMEKSKRYLLVLKPDLTYPDLNVIAGVTEGKYSLDETEQNIHSDEKTAKFKDELVKKYQIK
ncbi:hypothetical protein [Ferviditalea candida]|uniref:SAF domain-containing protein n=1 Tax=Ferviditalea candida TaxID=3108399 RepID=A0ABU5ZGX7_9BACL|nr:hypothetical protein [Paenibacillaceae bacterium T2]